MGWLDARAVCIGLAGAFSLVGCLLDFDGVGPAGSGASSSAGGSGAQSHEGGGGAPFVECGDSGACLEIPADLSGPYRLTTAGSCGDGELAFRAGLDRDAVQVTAPDAECTCGCDPPTDLGCPTSLPVTLYSNATCSMGPAAKMLNDGDCTDTSGKKSIGFLDPITVPHGQCGPDGAPASRPPVELSNERLGCLDPIPPCEVGGLCVPGDAPYCLVGDDTKICPAGFEERYAIVRDLPEDLVDTRDCSCECGQFSGDCAPSVQLFGDPDCNKSVGTAVAGLCFPNDDSISFEAARLTMGVAGSCDKTEALSGSVTAAPRIACCNRPL